MNNWVVCKFSLKRWDLKVGQMLLSPPESVVTCVQQGGRCGQDYGRFDVHVVVPENVHDDHEDVDKERKTSFPPGPEFVSHQDSSNTRWDWTAVIIFKISLLSSCGQLKILQLILKMISFRLFGQIGEAALVRYLCHIIEQLSNKNVANSQIAHSELHRHYRDCRRGQFGGPWCEALSRTKVNRDGEYEDNGDGHEVFIEDRGEEEDDIDHGQDSESKKYLLLQSDGQLNILPNELDLPAQLWQNKVDIKWKLKEEKQKNGKGRMQKTWSLLLRSDDCIFNPVSKKGSGRRGREEEKEYNVQLSPMQVTIVLVIITKVHVSIIIVIIIEVITMMMKMKTVTEIIKTMSQLQMRKSTDHQHPEFVVESITTQGFRCFHRLHYFHQPHRIASSK